MELTDPQMPQTPCLVSQETMAFCINEATTMKRRTRRRRMEMRQFKKQLLSQMFQESNSNKPSDSSQKPQNPCLVRQETMAFLIDGSAIDRNLRRMNMRRFKKNSTLPLISRGIFSVRYSEGEEDRVIHSISDGINDKVSTDSELITQLPSVSLASQVDFPSDTQLGVVESSGLHHFSQTNGRSTDVERSTNFIGDDHSNLPSKVLEFDEKEECMVGERFVGDSIYKIHEKRLTDGGSICSKDGEESLGGAVSDGSSCNAEVVHTKLPLAEEKIEKERAAHVSSSEVCERRRCHEEMGMSINEIDETKMRRAQNGGSLFAATCPPCGKLLFCGERRNMEDAGVIVPSFTQLRQYGGSTSKEGNPGGIAPCDLHFFGVYDGHGGSEASKYCARRLHHALAEEIAQYSITSPDNNIDIDEETMWKNVMSSCFLKMDKEVGGVCPHGLCDDIFTSTAACCVGTIAPENVGTTALVSILSSSRIVVANCGDSRAVLSRGGISIPLSTDHKPNRDDETSRIEQAGGRIIYWNGYRVGGLLAVSRAIGDRYLKRYVVSEPDVLCIDRTEEDECLIIASDGLWDVISNDTACDVARTYLANARKKNETNESSSTCCDAAAASVAAMLVKLAYVRGSKDNISVLVIDLKSRLN